jgi:hypothetical protein
MNKRGFLKETASTPYVLHEEPEARVRGEAA